MFRHDPIEWECVRYQSLTIATKQLLSGCDEVFSEYDFTPFEPDLFRR